MRLKHLAIPALAFLFGLAACQSRDKSDYLKGSAVIYCDDGFKNILDEEIEVFEFTNPEASILPVYVSQKEALDTLLEGKTDAIVITRELSKEEINYVKVKLEKTPRQECIAVDAVALITNKENPVTGLSYDEVGKILSGQITDWSQLAGDSDAPIQIVFDNPGSSTVSYLADKFLPKGKKFSENPNVRTKMTNSEVIDFVKENRNVVGIVSVSWLGRDLKAAREHSVEQRSKDYTNENDTISNELTSDVNVLKIQNPTEANDYDLRYYKPYQAYIESGQYPLVRKVYMITTAPYHSVMNSFYTFVTGFTGQKIISVTGILPYRMYPRIVNVE